MQFQETFGDGGGYVVEGDSITLEAEGFTLRARLVRDIDAHIDDDDTHNTDQSVTGVSGAQFADLLAARDAWFSDEWLYVGVVVSVERAGIMLDDHAASLWRIEANYPTGDNSYLTDVANELIDEALDAGKAARLRICE